MERIRNSSLTLSSAAWTRRGSAWGRGTQARRLNKGESNVTVGCAEFQNLFQLC